MATCKGCVFDLRTFSWWSCTQLHRQGFKWVEVTKLREWNYDPHSSVKSTTNSKHGRKWCEEESESHSSTEFSPVYFSWHEICILLYRWTHLAEGWVSSVSDLVLLAPQLWHCTEFLFYFKVRCVERCEYACVWWSSVNYGYIPFALCKYHMDIWGNFNYGISWTGHRITQFFSYTAAWINLLCVSVYNS